LPDAAIVIDHIQFASGILAKTGYYQIAVHNLLIGPTAISFLEKAPNDAGALIGHKVIALQFGEVLPAIDIATCH
jgi:hypothetical protein